MTSPTKTDELLQDLESKLEAKKADLRDLATMGAVVTSIHEIDAVLSVGMEMAIRLVNGEVGTILLEEGGSLHTKVSWGVRADFVRTLSYKDNRDVATYCFENTCPVVLSGSKALAQEGLRIETVICVPIRTGQKCFGVIVIINKADGSNFGDEDREILEMLMNFAAVAIDNSLLMKERLLRQKIEQEMLIARQVQETILPGDVDAIAGVEIGSVYSPARDVGGDFFDVIKIDDSNFIIVLGDVSNKGVPAALVMSAAAGIIKFAIAARPDISMTELAQETNNLLATGIIKDREMFVTLFLCRYDLSNKTLSYCNAGHVPGLFWDNGQKRVVELVEGGPIVGQFPGIAYIEGKRPIAGGDRLFLFTDGLTEATDRAGQLFGRERAEQVFVSEIDLSPKEFCARVKERVDEFARGCQEETIDDFTILQVKTE